MLAFVIAHGGLPARARHGLGAFSEPPWQAVLDVPRALSIISADSTIAGMFFLAVLEGAKRRSVSLSGARERYLPFGF